MSKPAKRAGKKLDRVFFQHDNRCLRYLRIDSNSELNSETRNEPCGESWSTVNTNSTTEESRVQPLLYETLTAGFDLKKVRFDFRSKAEATRRLVVGGAVKMKRK